MPRCCSSGAAHRTAPAHPSSKHITTPRLGPTVEEPRKERRAASTSNVHGPERPTRLRCSWKHFPQRGAE